MIVNEKKFTDLFKEKLIEASFNLRQDVLEYFHVKHQNACSDVEKEIFQIYIDNAELSRTEKRPLCQDTGYLQVYVERGIQCVFDFDFEKTVFETVKVVYQNQGLRLSMADPLSRKNSGDNLPVFIDTENVPGNDLKITMMIKGGGSENVSRVALFLPTSEWREVKDWVLKQVEIIGSKACPPYIIGLALGGNYSDAVKQSKKLLTKSIRVQPEDSNEKELKEALNMLNIGIQGLKIGETVMDVRIKKTSCHIATFPVAMSIACLAVRQSSFSYLEEAEL